MYKEKTNLRLTSVQGARRAVAYIVIVAALFSLIVPVSHAAPPVVDARAYILADADTGEILRAVNADQALVPASMTKLMTLYLVLEGVAENRIKWTDFVTISEYSNKISRQTSLSSFQLPSGSQYTVKELFYAAALNSSNAGAIALAEHIGGGGAAGGEGAFVKMMNEKARSFGLRDVNFVNSSGLNNSDLFGMHPAGTGAREDSRLSARSMAVIAYRLLSDYPEFISYSSMLKTTIRQGAPDQLVINSTNRMLAGGTYAVDGVKGLKTGYIQNAGYCFAGYAERASGRYISVVMGAPTSDERFRGSGRLLNFGFAVAEGREQRVPELALSYLYPDWMTYYEKSRFSDVDPLSLGDTGIGKMDDGRSDVLILNGNLYAISRRGSVSRPDGSGGISAAALVYFNRDKEIKLTGGMGLSALEETLSRAVDDLQNSDYCFKIEGAVKPGVITTISNAGLENSVRGGSGGGAVVAFWNHSQDNGLLKHGFTFYFIDSDRRLGGILKEADFGEAVVRIDKIGAAAAVIGRGADIPVSVN